MGIQFFRRRADGRADAQVLLRGEDREEARREARDFEGGELDLRVQHHRRERRRLDGGPDEGARQRAGRFDGKREVHRHLRGERLHEHRLREDEPADGVHEREAQDQGRHGARHEAAKGDWLAPAAAGGLKGLRLSTVIPQNPPRVRFGPLEGVRVLDLSRLLPGPYASLVLSDLGADVVKVEDPDSGDYLREISAGMFAALNRGKRSIIVDLKTPAGCAELRRLCSAADVLIESFRPGVLERLGFSDLLANPWRLVNCRISGYGQSGPWRDRAGHDIGYVALAGIVARNGGVPAGRLADLFGGGENAGVGGAGALGGGAPAGQGEGVCVAKGPGSAGPFVP